jgi:hypothetical protein
LKKWSWMPQLLSLKREMGGQIERWVAKTERWVAKEGSRVAKKGDG